jgi:acetyltransferase-like isoleucine patch superfamily enzyme
MTARLLAKRTCQGIALICVFPLALASGFGRVRSVFILFAQALALGPGAPGNYLRTAYYHLTLAYCSIDTTISFGAVFAHPGASVGYYVSIGSYCVIGLASIGERTQLASHVQVTSGRYQHDRDSQGNLVGSIDARTKVGARCWVGAGAIIMAELGDGVTIGAGAVVVKDIPPNSVAVGNPARVIRSTSPEQREGGTV